jgi:hypothetical protein
MMFNFLYNLQYTFPLGMNIKDSKRRFKIVPTNKDVG